MEPTLLRYAVRFAVLTGGVALVIYGAITWYYQDFSAQGLWLYDNGWRPHATHYLVAGMCGIPTALWDIFVLEQRRAARAEQTGKAAEVDPT